MRVADLRHRLTIQQKKTTRTPALLTIEEWVDFTTAYAAMETMKGREYITAAAVNAENTVRFRMRYSSTTGQISTAMRAKFGERVFDIQSATNVDGLNRWVVLMCVEVTAGGG